MGPRCFVLSSDRNKPGYGTSHVQCLRNTSDPCLITTTCPSQTKKQQQTWPHHEITTCPSRRKLLTHHTLCYKLKFAFAFAFDVRCGISRPSIRGHAVRCGAAVAESANGRVSVETLISLLYEREMMTRRDYLGWAGLDWAFGAGVDLGSSVCERVSGWVIKGMLIHAPTSGSAYWYVSGPVVKMMVML